MLPSFNFFSITPPAPKLVDFTINLFNFNTSQESKRTTANVQRLEIGFENISSNPKIADLLCWQYRLTRLVGRNDELVELIDWTNSDDKVSIRFITGDGGTGKSRLAAELALMLAHTEKWHAGFLDIDKPLDVPLGEVGTLIIIDYPEHKSDDDLDAILTALRRLPSDHKIRVLFLTRSPEQKWKERLNDARILRRVHRNAVTLKPFNPASNIEEAFTIFSESRVNAYSILNEKKESSLSPVKLELFSNWLAHQTDSNKDNHITRSLFLVAAGLYAALASERSPLTLSSEEIIMSLVHRENQRLRPTSKALNAEKHTLPRLISFATLCNGLPWTTIQNFNEHELELFSIPTNWNVRDILIEQGILNRDRQIPPVQPDIFGAAFFQNTFIRDSNIASEMVWLAQKHNTQWLQDFHRIHIDCRTIFSCDDHSPFSRMVEGVRGAENRMSTIKEVASSEIDYSTIFASIIFSKALEVELREAKDDESKAQYAEVLHNHSINLAAIGDANDALAASQRAVKIREELVEKWPETYTPTLANSLSNLSIRLNETGDDQGSLEAIRKAVEIREKLAEKSPDEFKPDLAMSLSNLSISLEAVGDSKGALNASQQSLEIREELARKWPDKFKPNLAMSLNNLSVDLYWIQDYQGALELVRKAIQIREELVQRWPDKYKPDLAMSLNNLSIYRGAVGDTPGAIEAIRKAIEIRATLAQTWPDKFKPDWANSLSNLSNYLSESGDTQGAIDATIRAIELISPFADKFPQSPHSQLLEMILKDKAKYEQALAAEGE